MTDRRDNPEQESYEEDIAEYLAEKYGMDVNEHMIPPTEQRNGPEEEIPF